MNRAQTYNLANDALDQAEVALFRGDMVAYRDWMRISAASG